ncbi:astacin-like [Lineus longissimus]|uniref:astacin-like n=1 Tax=Lineus longissimus TaxID=88925 RepID=UPI002B4EE2BA
MNGIIFLMGVALVGAVDDETLRGYFQLDDTTWINPKTDEIYQPETAGDMLFEDNQGNRKRNTPFFVQTWTDGIVPYTFGETWANDAYFTQSVRKGMDVIEAKTCIKFVPWTNQPHRINLVRIRGCNSYVGRLSGATQDINLSVGCLRIGVVMHELIHALGFQHEHERADREGFISVNLDNVYDANKQWLTVNHGIKLSEFGYDVDSVMHYGAYAFAKSYNYPVITQLKDFDKGRIGQRTHLSIKDIKELNQLYKCDTNNIQPTTTPTTTTTKSTSTGKVITSCNFDTNWCGIAVSGSTQRWGLRKNVGGNGGSCAGWLVSSNEVQSYERSTKMTISNIQPYVENCLSFRYLIQTSGVIDVKLGGVVLRTLSNADVRWFTATTNLAPSNSYRELKLGIAIGVYSYGQVNIDDVVLSTGRC